TFDGLLETPLWARVDLAVLDWASEPSFGAVPILREDQMVRLLRTVALVGFVLLFLAAYAAVCRLTAAAAGERAARTSVVLRLFADRRAALWSQIPMVALMVTYTMLSLWILSQPIVEIGVR